MSKLLTGVVVALAALAATWSSPAVSPALADARYEGQFGFTTQAPGAATGFSAEVLYKHPDDPDAKPPAIVELEIELPAGSRFDTDATAVCTASDEEIRLLGPDACPEGSQIGTGTFTGLTGVDAADPFVGDILAFNGGDAVIEVVVFQGTRQTAGIDRLEIHGATLLAHPPATPGGPPDGRTVPRQIELEIEPHGRFLKTPSSCPADGSWRFASTAEFADGGSGSIESLAPCEPPEPKPITRGPCAGLEATVVGSKRGELLRGSAGDDVIVAHGGADRIRAGAGDDVVCAGRGGDMVRPGSGDDRVLAGRGRDRVAAQAGSDSIRGGRGRDRLIGGRGADALRGGGGRDRLRGGPGADSLIGGPGRDRLRGGPGADRRRQ